MNTGINDFVNFIEYTEPPEDLISFSEIRTCADLMRLEGEGLLEIPVFQRGKVWSRENMARFIDSLILNLPIPSLCFGFDVSRKKYIIIDGLQRITSIKQFFYNSSFALPELRDITPDLRGKTSSEFWPEKISASVNESLVSEPDYVYNPRETEEYNPLFQYFQRIKEATIPVNVLRYDGRNETHMRFIYLLFTRLNTGGVPLSHQEIRNCLFNGAFVDFLRELNNYPVWKQLLLITEDSRESEGMELILSLFALLDEPENLENSFADFINSYLFKHREIDKENDHWRAKKELFLKTVDLISGLNQKESFSNFNTLQRVIFLYKAYRLAELADNTMPPEYKERLRFKLSSMEHQIINEDLLGNNIDIIANIKELTVNK